jgi:hypothetical protein
MSPHRTRRPTTFASLIALTATLAAASLGLAACGGSSSTTTTTTTQTAANAAATGTTTAGAGTSGSTSTGTSSTPTTPGASTTGATPAARAARFAAVRTCLSKKGIALPQRGAGGFPGASGAGGFAGAGGGAQLPKGMSRAQFAEALRSCGAGFRGSHLGKGVNGFKNPYNNPRFHAVLTRYAACLRQNGVNVGEPNTSGKGSVFDTKGINTGSPQFKAATVKCRSTLLGAFKSNRAHPGASAAG